MSASGPDQQWSFANIAVTNTGNEVEEFGSDGENQHSEQSHGHKEATTGKDVVGQSDNLEEDAAASFEFHRLFRRGGVSPNEASAITDVAQRFRDQDLEIRHNEFDGDEQSDHQNHRHLVDEDAWRHDLEAEIEAITEMDDNDSTLPANLPEHELHFDTVLDNMDEPIDIAAERAAAAGLGWEDPEDNEDPVPSAPPSSPEIFECVCGDVSENPTEFIFLSCGHVRCNDCLDLNVRVGLESRMSFPPSCCRWAPIELSDVAEFLNEELVARWCRVAEEFGDISPVYCGKKECSKYLNKKSLIEGKKWALCNECKLKTCTTCGCLQSAHKNDDDSCPETVEKLNRDLMEREGWKPCPQCRHMIERIHGCDHMICQCSFQFCYACGRGYSGGMPCNCNGQNNWVEEDAGAADPAVQQRLLEDIQNENQDGWLAGDVRAPDHWHDFIAGDNTHANEVVGDLGAEHVDDTDDATISDEDSTVRDEVENEYREAFDTGFDSGAEYDEVDSADDSDELPY